MFTSKKLASSLATVGLLLVGTAHGQDSSGMMRIASGPEAAATPTPTPAPGPAPVADSAPGRFGIGHGEACDGNADCPPSAHCGIWHTCLCNPDHGYGCRFLDWHCYSMTYPVNPWYYDPRDTRVYAAVGFGAPMTVPIAPTVQTQVNYSWGIPSSRITPISRVAYQPGALMGATAPFPNAYAAGPAAPLPPVMPNSPPGASAPVPPMAPAR
jgi:hypothetical protein